MICSDQQTPPEYVTTAELSRRLQKPQRTLAWRARKGLLPVVPTGGRNYVFNWTEIEKMNLAPRAQMGPTKRQKWHRRVVPKRAP
jgi:hypothetical protein